MNTNYKGVCNTIQSKINSFKTLYSQTKGPGKFACPSPMTLNSFTNWVNKGAVIQTCSPTQVARWAKSANKNFNTSDPNPTSCKNILSAKFGKTTIKAVARTKTGSFMVATSPTCNGRSFSFPK